MLTELLSSVTIDSGDVQAMYMLGLTYMHLGNYGVAVQKFRVLIDKAPFHKQARFNLGNVYVRLGLMDQANAALQRFQEIDLEDKTLTLLQQRVDHDSKDVDAWYQLGRIHDQSQSNLMADEQSQSTKKAVSNVIKYFSAISLK